jgi:Rrf2 family protein
LAVKDDGINKIGIKQISKDLNLPTPFLGKIMQTLAKHKLLASTKGPHGGFALLKTADKISILDVIEIIDGEDIFQECLIGLKVCAKPGSTVDCPFHKKSHPVRQKIYDLFKNQTIGDLAKGIKSIDDILRL